MANKKCMTCGLVNFQTESVCKRCGAALPASDDAYRTAPLSMPRPSEVSDGYAIPAGYVTNQIKRLNRNVLLANLLLVAVVLGAGVFNGRYLYNLVRGPDELDQVTLASIRDAESLQRYYVTVQGEEAIDTGMSAVRSERGRRNEKVEFEYSALVVDGKLLLVKNKHNSDATRLTGALVNIPSFEQNSILQKLYQQEPEAQGAFLPVMLDATGFSGPGLIGFAIGIPFLALAAWNVKKVTARKASPGIHPVMRSLEKYGVPDIVAANIDREASAGGNQSGKVLITPSWLLSPQAFTLQVMRIDELVWVYKKVTKHYTNFIPTGKTYAAMICSRRGTSIEIPTARGENETNRILDEIVRQAPWVLAGFSQDLQKAWKSNAAEVIHAVDSRRAQVQAAAEARESA